MKRTNAKGAVILLGMGLLLTLSLPPRPSAPQEPGIRPEREIDPPVPLSALEAKTWLTLHTKRIPSRPKETTLRALLQAAREAAADGSWKVVIRLDPISLLENEVTLDTPIDVPWEGVEERPTLYQYLRAVGKPLGLALHVGEAIVNLKGPCDECPGPRQATEAEARTWSRLHQTYPIAINPTMTLPNVIDEVRQSLDKAPTPIAITVSPEIQEESKLQLDEQLDLSSVPLCTALRVLLSARGWQFHVDRRGTIHIDKGYDAEMDGTDLAEYARFDKWLHHIEQHGE